MTYVEREIRHLFGKAVHSYGLIDDGDRIAVAVSGGKDSVALLYLLKERLKYIPISYELRAIYIDLGFDPLMPEKIKDLLERLEVPHDIILTDYGIRAHSPENREHPCFLCARLRRMTLFKRAWETGFPKIAFGHNQDDFIETFFMNICYSGQTSAIVPKQEFFKGKITVIRPMALIPSKRISRFVETLGLPHLENPCPSAGKSSRIHIRRLLQELYKVNDKIRGNVYRAMSHVNLEYLPPPLEDGKGDRKK
ncbi:tRNA lysidine(34) synthetase [Thermodesulforhabdus norvegica]|uniref:tRNA 2-thiocytidine biosynthesis protein TtcA n=1 Tax=Thermodesulforhabdus norvegica TaxID=39841 RepID=A0A1I4SDI9_9BACT|nr:tRNA 2-thiocytidine biosynthesis TtcA family protein [Thermodesulforhabdus norvegica]SFM62542.1 tRNA 2-thiocytidine biosynthesis protein TtcA [Thermodesulforhabdus norvegica]